METKSDAIRRAMHAGDWPRALRLAARLPRLDRHAAAIKRGHECLSNPGFYRQLGRDPDDCVAAGIAALRDRFPV